MTDDDEYCHPLSGSGYEAHWWADGEPHHGDAEGDQATNEQAAGEQATEETP